MQNDIMSVFFVSYNVVFPNKQGQLQTSDFVSSNLKFHIKKKKKEREIQKNGKNKNKENKENMKNTKREK